MAEESAQAAAYVVVSVCKGAWTLEECGDRDPSGARIGAILQTLAAREPAEQPAALTGWLPRGLLPPQLVEVAKRPRAEVMMIRPLSVRATAARELAESDILYWHPDVF